MSLSRSIHPFSLLLAAANLAAAEEEQQEQERDKTGFLDLSQELRNDIYDRTLPKHCDYTIYCGHRIHDPLVKVFNISDSNHRCQYINKLEPGLAMVNKQVRAEVLPMFYGQNSFSSLRCSMMMGFFRCLGPDRAKMLRQVTLGRAHTNASAHRRLSRALSVLGNDPLRRSLVTIEAWVHSDEEDRAGFVECNINDLE